MQKCYIIIDEIAKMESKNINTKVCDMIQMYILYTQIYQFYNYRNSILIFLLTNFL